MDRQYYTTNVKKDLFTAVNKTSGNIWSLEKDDDPIYIPENTTLWLQKNDMEAVEGKARSQDFKYTEIYWRQIAGSA